MAKREFYQIHRCLGKRNWNFVVKKKKKRAVWETKTAKLGRIGSHRDEIFELCIDHNAVSLPVKLQAV